MDPNDCPPASKLLKFLNGELHEEDCLLVDKHLETCEGCVETVQELTSHPSPRNAPQLPSTFASRILDELVSSCGAPQEVLNKKHHRSAPDKVGDYRILREIGHGGMGIVYLAEHPDQTGPVAVKVLNQEGNRRLKVRFAREMRMAQQLEHPNIVRTLNVGEAKGTSFIAMEYLDGSDVGTLSRRGILPISQACEIIRQAAIGLQHAHENGLVHRDIKPSNLLVTKDGTVKLLDLGLARPVGIVADEDEITASGEVMGTIDYMSPEQYRAPAKVGAVSDVYGLGATLYRLLVGEPPLAKWQSPREKLEALAEGQRGGLPDGASPKELADVIGRMLNDEPDDRVQTAAQVVELLGPYAQGEDLTRLSASEPLFADGNANAIASMTTRAISSPSNAPRVNPLWLWFYAALGIGLVAFVYWLVTVGRS